MLNFEFLLPNYHMGAKGAPQEAPGSQTHKNNEIIKNKLFHNNRNEKRHIKLNSIDCRFCVLSFSLIDMPLVKTKSLYVCAYMENNTERIAEKRDHITVDFSRSARMD